MMRYSCATEAEAPTDDTITSVGLFEPLPDTPWIPWLLGRIGETEMRSRVRIPHGIWRQTNGLFVFTADQACRVEIHRCVCPWFPADCLPTWNTSNDMVTFKKLIAAINNEEPNMLHLFSLRLDLPVECEPRRPIDLIVRQVGESPRTTRFIIGVAQ